MQRSTSRTLALACHPATPAASVRGIAVRAHSHRDGGLALGFVLQGDLSRLCVPTPRPGGRAEGLWQHTCFEVFVAEANTPAYREFNFAPSGQWAAYAFRSYRDGGPLGNDMDPAIAVRRAADRLELDAFIGFDRLPALPDRGGWWLGLAAVVEEAGGTLSYWALRHPPGRPDFHHPDAFALEFDPLNGVAAHAGRGKG